MSYGGLRGAVGIALSMSLHAKVREWFRLPMKAHRSVRPF